jgi:hypothetical protein
MFVSGLVHAIYVWENNLRPKEGNGKQEDNNDGGENPSTVPLPARVTVSAAVVLAVRAA